MTWLFLFWLTVSSCIFVDAKHLEKEDIQVRTHHGPAEHVKEKVCEAADKACHDERAKMLEVETEGRMAHAAHTVKDKINEAVHHLRGDKEDIRVEQKRHLHHAKEKADETGSSAANAFLHAKDKIIEAKDSAIENTKLAGEKVKHKAEEAFDSTASTFKHAGDKVKHAAEDAYDSTTSSIKSAKDKVTDRASSAYDQASAKASDASDYVKGKVWGTPEKSFFHIYFPGFHAWMGIFTAVIAQMTLGWLWYGMLFRKLFMQALREDRVINVGSYQTFGVSDKIHQAGTYVKDSAAAHKLSDAAQKLAHSTAGQKLSQTGEFVKDKVAAGTASIQHAAASVKDKAEATAYQAKEKISGAAHSAQETAAQAGERLRESTMGQKIAQTSQDVRDTAHDARDRLTGTQGRYDTTATTTTYADATTGNHPDFAGPYSVWWGPVASLFTSFLRSFFMFHWLKVLWVHNYFGAFILATMFFFGSQFCSMHHYVWEGRPLKLLLLDHGCELALNVSTALIVYHGLAH
jgi:ElaB/YqjD/DUF883 family membrane-anchored ribosome-binding protein